MKVDLRPKELKVHEGILWRKYLVHIPGNVVPDGTLYIPEHVSVECVEDTLTDIINTDAPSQG